MLKLFMTALVALLLPLILQSGRTEQCEISGKLIFGLEAGYNLLNFWMKITNL